MKRLIALFIALALVGIVQAEERTLQGTVIDQDGKPIEGANVVLKRQYYDEIIEINSTSDETGAFNITYDSDYTFEFKVSAEGYTGYYSSFPAEVQGRLIVLYNALNFKAGELTSIILPIVPDASLGKYFRLDREEGDTLIFEREYMPQANVPYAFIPKKDTRIDLTGMDLSTEPGSTMIVGRQKRRITFIGSYISHRGNRNGSSMYSLINGEIVDDGVHAFAYRFAMQGTLTYHYDEFGKNGGEIPKIVFRDPDEDYTPFVEMGKHWHVLGFSVGPYSSVDNYCFGSKEVTIGEHTYLNLYKEDPYEVMDAEEFNDNGIIDIPSLGLFREEDRRVYLYDKDTEQEYCVYDFTLEVGDTFDFGWGDEADYCVVTKVDHINVKGNELKTITFSSVIPEIPDEYDDYEIWKEPLHINHKWIEGVGGWSGPTSGWMPNTYDSSWSHHVAYVGSFYGSRYYPFSFTDMWGDNNFVLGQDLVRGKEIPYESALDGDKLSYEIVDEKLHVTGTMWMQCGPNNYIYCKLKPSDTYNTYQITLQEEGVNPQIDRRAPYAVDLYFNLPYYLVRDVENFVYVDSEGEHPIPEREYIPFVEEGKVWKVGVGTQPSNIQRIEYYYFEGDTIFDTRVCKKWMCQTVDKTQRKTSYIGAVYDERKQVYQFLPGMDNSYMLYDFASPVKTYADIYLPQQDLTTQYYIVNKDTLNRNGYKLPYSLVRLYTFTNGEEAMWIEGIGSLRQPNDNLCSYNTQYYNLMSCTIDSDTLYSDAKYIDAVSEYWDEDGEVKKQKIDFTHVIKTKPTSPRVAANISLVEGEYDNAVLCIDFEGMTGQYTITVRKDDEPDNRFSASHETHNLQSLDVNLAGYPEGDYTVVVENDEESYTAHFALPLDGTGIESIQNSRFKIDNNAPVYDLSGRRVVNPKRGLYIQGGRKVLIE